MKEEAGGQVYAGDAIRALLGVGVVQEHHLHTERRGEGRAEEDAIYTVVHVYMHLDCANFELTNHIAYRVENKSLISTPRKLISTAGKLIFQVCEYT